MPSHRAGKSCGFRTSFKSTVAAMELGAATVVTVALVPLVLSCSDLFKVWRSEVRLFRGMLLQ